MTTDIVAYGAAAGALLRADCERNTIGVTVLDAGLRRAAPLDPPELYGWWVSDSGNVTGGASITPPWPVLLEVVPEDSLRPLAEKLLDAGVDVAGVNASTETSATFGAIWGALTGDQSVLSMASRLFRLVDLSEPERRPAGEAVAATESDVPKAMDWFTRFGREVHGPMPRVEENVRQRLVDGGLWFWRDGDGELVSLVGHTHPVEGVVRVGPVYTPVDQRGQGYAENLTYDVSRRIVARGMSAVLFTDQANPTSNAIYTRVGYRPVMDRLTMTFERADLSKG